MAATTFSQFRRFSTDAYGLERLLRFIQAFLHIIVALAASHGKLVSRLAGLPINHDLFRGFADLRALLGTVRRFFRFFRFFDAFASSYNIFLDIMQIDEKKGSAAGPNPYLLQTLDALAGTFNGMYLLLEALTLFDALNMPGLAILGKEMEHFFKIESQRCWFLALACGAFACLLRINTLRGQSIQQVPVEEPLKQNSGSDKRSQKKIKFTEKEKEDASREKAQTAAQIRRLTRKLVASVLDLALPGSVIGWIPAPSGLVGAIMLVTSFLTGLDVWERCGKEVGKL